MEARTDVGKVRLRNEDAVVVGTSVMQTSAGRLVAADLMAPTVVAVLDGMGGPPAGDLASRTAAGTLAEAVARAMSTGREHELEPTTLIRAANRAVGEQMDCDGRPGMGTTVVALVATSDAVYVVNAGDSNAYGVSGDYLVELSIADRSPNGDITSCLGGTDRLVEVHPNVSILDRVDVGDRLLLCSDGLTDFVPIERLEELVIGRRAALVDELIAESLAAGAPDNVTVVLVEVAGAAP